jgi:hypothetical protein
MLSENSILRRIPPQLDRQQNVFLDGIRHAAEIASLAYNRLTDTLTQLALTQNAGLKLPQDQITSAFLDAWAFVDEVDRFRSLVQLMPGMKLVGRTDGRPGFIEISESVRALRNVADHLGQRVDYVVANEGTALGCLKWLTVLDAEQGIFLSAILLAGTLRSNTKAVLTPIGRTFLARTDHIHLESGAHSASLSDVRAEMAERVRSIEASLEKSVADLGLTGEQAGTDMMMVVKIQAIPEPDQMDEREQ